MKQLFASFATCFTALGVLLSPATAFANNTFKISAIPDYNATEMTRSFDSFAEYLSKETGLTVQYVPVTDYAAVVTVSVAVKLIWFGSAA